MAIDGINIGTEFTARMVYGNGTRSAGRFIDLTAAQTAFLRYIVTWRGEAIGAVGTTPCSTRSPAGPNARSSPIRALSTRRPSGPASGRA